ncbi:hypothetical protein [Staphylococcus marylandisciuri]|nr:hypothetical protein [Staphylococcus marylandisciuri]
MRRGPNKEKLVNQFQQAMRVGVGPNKEKLGHNVMSQPFSASWQAVDD